MIECEVEPFFYPFMPRQKCLDYVGTIFVTRAFYGWYFMEKYKSQFNKKNLLHKGCECMLNVRVISLKCISPGGTCRGDLGAEDYRLKGKSFSHRICTKCELGILEDIKHLLMQCPYYTEERKQLQHSIQLIGTELSDRIINDPPNYFNTIMGKQPEDTDFQEMIAIWLMTGDHISRLYKRTVIGRV